MSHRMRCPDCGTELTVIATAYGERATCIQDKITWTRILGKNPEKRWHVEKYTGIGGNTA